MNHVYFTAGDFQRMLILVLVFAWEAKRNWFWETKK